VANQVTILYHNRDMAKILEQMYMGGECGILL